MNFILLRYTYSSNKILYLIDTTIRIMAPTQLSKPQLKPSLRAHTLLFSKQHTKPHSCWQKNQSMLELTDQITITVLSKLNAHNEAANQ